MKRLKNYGDKNRIGKLIATCIKAVTAILGASAILSEQKPYISLGILCVGAIANEIINFYDWDNG